MTRATTAVALLTVALGCTRSSPTPEPEPESFDLVVYGGTAAGVVAAVQARAMGRTVVLLEPGAHLGGLTSGGLGNTDIGNKGAIGGLSRRFYERVAAHYARPEAWTQETREEYRERSSIGNQGHGREDPLAERTGVATMWVFEPSVAEGIFAAMAEEAGVDVRFGQRLDLDGGVSMDGPALRSIRMESGARLRGPGLHRRDLRGRPDGDGRRLVHRGSRGERRLRRDPQRRPDGPGRQPPVQGQDRSLRRAGGPEERPPARHPRRRPRRGGIRRPPGAGLQLPHDPHRRPGQPPAHPAAGGLRPPALRAAAALHRGRALRRPRPQQPDAEPQDRREQPRGFLLGPHRGQLRLPRRRPRRPRADLRRSRLLRDGPVVLPAERPAPARRGP